MEATALCSRLRMSVLLLLVAEVLCDAQEADAPVILEGPLQPVMEGDNVTLHCRNQMTFSNYTAEFFKDGMLMGRSKEGTIIIHSVSKSDAGPYKCQISGVGESLENWLYVVGGVFLEGPDGPVMEGDSVTLHCRNNKDPSKRIADFSRHGVLIRTGYGREMTIPRVAKAHEGPYKCIISGFGESAEFQLVVQDGVFLEGPDRPVMEGDSVTLHCRNNKDPSKRIADFSRHGVLIRTGYGREMTIPRVAKAHEGPYKCSISGFGESAEFQLVVQVVFAERRQETQPFLIYRTVFICVAVALMSLLVGLLHCGKIGNG